MTAPAPDTPRAPAPPDRPAPPEHPTKSGRPTTTTPAAPTRLARPAPPAPLVPPAPSVPPTPAAPTLLRLVREDLHAVLARDPSCSGRLEALLHAGWQGLALYRLAHRQYRRGRRLRAALLTRLSRLLTGMEIHAGARIGRRAFIDHGFGVVIGETAVVGDDVTLYHGVTLGSRGWLHDGRGTRRHPVIGDDVLIGTGASVLGPVTVGDGSRIAAHALVLHDVPARTPASRRPGPARPTPSAPRRR
ncbi:serine O-acetyltransferase EpsC [Streptomyces sp. NPDC004065]|uniref:serine O-acetyltransferase EpsC n=1 Tax=Streptomyces sp. NPDC004065 TaxID=3364689 RepID=UPI00384CFEB4